MVAAIVGAWPIADRGLLVARCATSADVGTSPCQVRSRWDVRKKRKNQYPERAVVSLSGQIRVDRGIVTTMCDEPGAECGREAR